MRASELLGASVVDADGRRIGVVTGLDCTSDGPRHGPLAAPRLRGLRVIPHGWGSALGYQQRRQVGPWLIRRTVEWMQRRGRIVSWDDVADVVDGEIRLRRDGLGSR